MKKIIPTYTWSCLPFVFCSAFVLSSQATAAPSISQQYKDAQQVNRIQEQYVGGNTQIGVGVTDEGNVDARLNQVISGGNNHSTSVGLWADYDVKGNDKGLQGRGVQVNHNWVSRNAAGEAKHVNKVFGAYDKNAAGHEKATIGYGQENENVFWEGHVSKGLSGNKDSRTNGTDIVSDRAYEYGIGGSIGKFLPEENLRVRAGLDHEWSTEVADNEKDARNTTLSAGVEKFFRGTGHSVSLDVAASKRDGGYSGSDDSTNVSGRLGYQYEFGGNVYQSATSTKRVRVEVPGTNRPPQIVNKTQYKKVPTYKTVPVFENKTVRTPYKKLVKSTMALEGQTFFKLNSHKLIPSAQKRLTEVAKQIRKTGYKGSIRITGNTCGLGSAKYDQLLSERRANEVRKFLIKQGFNPDHLMARGLGKAHPKYPNVPGHGFKNRRVDIEYIAEKNEYKQAYKTENKRIQTGTQKVVSGFKNVPVGSNNVMVDNGVKGSPRVVWKTETIKNPPAWIQRALHNNIKHNTSVNTFSTQTGSAPTAPVATNDNRQSSCNAPVTINVLGNDTDPNGSPLSIKSFTQPSYGVVTQTANGVLTYTPNGTNCGMDDNFTYTVENANGEESTATVTIALDEDDTVKAADVSASTVIDGAIPIDVLNNDDADASINGIVSQPSNGTVSISGSQIIYTPNPGFSGTDVFTYEAIDPNGNTDTATVTVTIEPPANTAPTAATDSVTTECNAPISINALSNDTDPENDTLSIVSFTQATNGVVTQDANGQFIYTPNANTCGTTDSFTYTISDGNGGQSIGTVNVTVNDPVNNPPKAVDDSETTLVDQPVTLDSLSNDSDPDGDTLTITNVGNPANGSATISGGQIIYTPNPGYTGVDTFTYTISDGNGGTATATETVTISAPANNAPNANDDSSNVACGAPVTITVLNNDTDPDGDTLSVLSFTQPTNGSVTQGNNGTLVYTSNGNVCDVQDTFTYTVTDGNGASNTAVVTVDVEPKPNTKPIAVDDAVTTPQDQAVTLPTLANDSDPDGDNLTITNVASPSNGTATVVNGSIVYTPNSGYVGTDSFAYTISDGNGGTATATETVTITAAPNKAPEAVDDSTTTEQGQPVTLNTLSNDSDPDGDNLTITNVVQPQNGSAQISGGTIIYTPNPNFVGTETFDYTISDGNGGTATATETVIITAINKAPIANTDTAATGCTAITINLLDNDTDPEGDTISLVSVSPGSLGTATISGNSIIYKPGNHCHKGGEGLDSFSYTITDGTNQSTGTVNVDVQGEAGETKTQPDDVVTEEDQPISINVLANDAGVGLNIIAVDTPSNGSAIISGNQILYTPNPGFVGMDSFWYTIEDQNGYQDASLVVVDVVAK